ncbi:restriction endonuclease subunit S (plasmid) [Wohlfahrtiimonas chitiniclastica]|uniref:restriction endonuclease subunit S n=1 Tax=Wohlfahrtiimonas chitiniclastica TaxID=400946 RepID=UPI0007B40FE0|nr:restriction endonuclease subunit S [Wohlfahrtiimonas chitiniclastica]KZS22124.1 hypothetical protein BMY_2136 [Wohlfahrtiimonas chitiniclastica]WHR56388.1 restriction endonuclease subunit S [Wohlfahrtiimonas chitiniclastica]
MQPKLRFPEFDSNISLIALGEITLWRSGNTPSKKNELYWGGDIPWISASSMKSNRLSNSELCITDKAKAVFADEKDLLILVRGSMLFNKIPIGICERRVSFNQDVKSISFSEKSKNSAEYLLYWFESKENLILSMVTGTGIGAGKLETIELQNLSFSKIDVTEQTKIADFLSAVDKKITLLEQQQQAWQTYKQGMMQKLFSGELRFKDENGQEFPAWEEVGLAEIANIIGGGTPSTTNMSYWNGDIIWLTPSEISQKYISESRRTITSKGLDNSSAKLLPIGTIVFTSRATIGEVAILRQAATTNQGFQSFICKPGCNNEFLYYWCLAYKNEFISKASGSTFLEISKMEISKMILSLPEVAEQQQIADCLSGLDAKIENITEQLDKMREWKKGLLQQMFV